MKNVYIVSGMTDSISYCFHTEPKSANDVPSIREKITIRGGRGLPSNRSGFGEQSNDISGTPLWTAEGIVTAITEAQYARLKEHHLFKKHMDAGRLKVVNHDIRGNHQAVKNISRDMEGPDSHSLLTKATVKVRVKVGPEKTEDSHRI